MPSHRHAVRPPSLRPSRRAPPRLWTALPPLARTQLARQIAQLLRHLWNAEAHRADRHE